jgi:hypothetical protein
MIAVDGLFLAGRLAHRRFVADRRRPLRGEVIERRTCLMYRENDRAPKAPTVVEYESKRFRVGFFLLALLLLLIGLGMLAGCHFTQLKCSRTDDATSGTCQVRRYGMIRSLDEELTAGEIASFDVKVRTGSKGSKYAEVRLFMTPESHRSTMELETGSWGHIDPSTALQARSDFLAFQSGRVPSVDLWLRPSLATMTLMSLFGLALLAIGVAMLREQLGQLRPVRIVLDHAREVVVVRKHEIPWREIADVTVEHGRALFWSSGKNEHVPGYRLVFVRRSGTAIPATKAFRAGDPNAHERAQRTVRRVLQLDRD